MTSKLIRPDTQEFRRLNDISVAGIPDTSDSGAVTITHNTISGLPVSSDVLLNSSDAVPVPDRRFQILGRKNGLLKQEINVGRKWVVNGATYSIINQAGPPAPPLLINPATAGAAAAVHDKSFTSAVAAINGMFGGAPSDPKLTTAEASLVRQLSALRADPSRLFFRLAQLWWYTALYCPNGVAPNFSGAVNLPSKTSNIAQVRALWQSAKHGANVVPIDLMNYPGFELMATSILAHAVNVESLGPTAIGAVPSVLSMPVMMGPTQVCYAALIEVKAINSRFESADIWSVAKLLEVQYGVDGKFDDYVSSIGGVLYAPAEGVDPVFGSPDVSIGLPPMDTRGYALYPISVARDALKAAEIATEPYPHDVLATAVLHTQLLSASYAEAAWQKGLGLSGETRKIARERENHLVHSFKRFGGAISPVLSQAFRIARTVNEGFCLGPTTASMQPTALITNPLLASIGIRTCTAWEELVDVLPRVPVHSLGAIIHPTRTTNILSTKEYHSVDSAINGTHAAAARLINDTGLDLQLWHRTADAPIWATTSVKPMRNYRGEIADKPYPRFSLLEHTDTMLVTRALTALSALNAHEYRKGQSTWDWWVSAVPTHTPDVSIGTTYSPLSDGVMLGLAEQSVLPSATTDAAGGTAGSHTPKSADEALDVLARKKRELDESAAEAEGIADGTTVHPLETMKKKEREVYNALKEFIKAGPMQQMVNYYREICSSKQRATNISAVDYYAPLVGSLAQQLQEVSLSTWIKQVPRERRTSIINNYTTAVKRVLPFTTRNVSLDVMADHVARSQALELALNQCSALTPDELKNDGFDLDIDQVEFLNNMAQGASDNGIPLDDFFTRPEITKKMVYDKKDPEYLAYRHNFTYDADQSGIKKTERRVTFTVPAKTAKYGPDDAYMAPFMSAEIVQAESQKLQDKVADSYLMNRYKRVGLEPGVDLYDSEMLNNLEKSEATQAAADLRSSIEGLADSWDSDSQSSSSNSESKSAGSADESKSSDSQLSSTDVPAGFTGDPTTGATSPTTHLDSAQQSGEAGTPVAKKTGHKPTYSEQSAVALTTHEASEPPSSDSMPDSPPPDPAAVKPLPLQDA